jgi:hypothetical protein
VYCWRVYGVGVFGRSTYLYIGRKALEDINCFSNERKCPNDKVGAIIRVVYYMMDFYIMYEFLGPLGLL